MAYLTLDECKNGFLYRLASRNLSYGVFREGVKGFVGIREKFGDYFLFTEYHWDTGPPFGTVHPLEELEPVPEGMALEESLGTVCEQTNRPAVYFSDWRYRDDGEPCVEEQGWDDKDGAVGEETRRPISQGDEKGWRYKDTGEKLPGFSMSVSNKALFNWLEEKGKQYRATDPDTG
jgi:hypothetical protein